MLSFITLENDTASTNVIINTAGLTLGEHSLVLQSFDENSDGVESTLKTDTITVIVTEPLNDSVLKTLLALPKI